MSRILSTRGGGWWYPSMPYRFPDPHPRGKLRGLAGGGGWSQAHTQGSVSPGPHQRGCIPACTEEDPPTATAAGGTHPTGMHSCVRFSFNEFCATALFLSMTIGTKLNLNRNHWPAEARIESVWYIFVFVVRRVFSQFDMYIRISLKEQHWSCQLIMLIIDYCLKFNWKLLRKSSPTLTYYVRYFWFENIRPIPHPQSVNEISGLDY